MLSIAFIALVAAASPERQSVLEVGVRHTVAFPADRLGVSNNTSVNLTAIFRSRHAVGLRMLFIPDPPKVYYERTPEFAYGPMVTYSYFAPIGRHFDLYPSAALGFALGQAPTTKANVVLPLLQAGVGMRYHTPIGPTAELQISPELGVAPFVLAPFFGLNLGVLFPLRDDEEEL